MLPLTQTLPTVDVIGALGSLFDLVPPAAAVIVAADKLISDTADAIVGNASGDEQLAAITSVVAVENSVKLNAASSDETAGGAPSEKKDTTARGKQGQREGVQQTQKDNVKKGKGAGQRGEQPGGYRVRDNRSSQGEQHSLDRLQNLSDAEKEFNEP